MSIMQISEVKSEVSEHVKNEETGCFKLDLAIIYHVKLI